jgi:hypothetical protein
MDTLTYAAVGLGVIAIISTWTLTWAIEHPQFAAFLGPRVGLLPVWPALVVFLSLIPQLVLSLYLVINLLSTVLAVPFRSSHDPLLFNAADLLLPARPAVLLVIISVGELLLVNMFLNAAYAAKERTASVDHPS